MKMPAAHRFGTGIGRVLIVGLMGVAATSAVAQTTYVGVEFQDSPFFPFQHSFALPTDLSPQLTPGAELTEVRIAMDLQVLPGALLNGMIVTVFAPRPDTGSGVVLDEFSFFPLNELAFDGTRLFGEVVIHDLDGPIHVNEFGFSEPWGVRVVDLIGPGFWGVGDFRAEFDILVPEPASLTLLAFGSLCCLRRRR